MKSTIIPVTVRRLIPSAWQNAQIYINSEKVNSKISTDRTKKYVVFDVVPDQGEVYLSKSDKITASEKLNDEYSVKVDPNPFSGVTNIKAKGQFRYYVYSPDGRLVENGKGRDTMNLGNNLSSGTYLLTINHNNQINGSRIIKK
jgi:hypothetical protein